MQKLPLLKLGDSVEVIAPASRCSDERLVAVQELLSSWGLCCLIREDLFGQDLLCANRDEIRFSLLKSALDNPETKALICVRGGYGSMRLIPDLYKLKAPTVLKLFVGMSDITALHLFLQQRWSWPSLHGALALDQFSPQSILRLKSILFGEVDQLVFQGVPLNSQATHNKTIKTTVTGGNLSLIQASIGTNWQMNAKGKIILLEEIGERGYRIDRMLEHLRQAQIFKGCVAIVFGDCLGGEEPNGGSLIQSVLERFALSCDIPILQIGGIGHGYDNFPIPLGTEATIQLGQTIQLVCSR